VGVSFDIKKACGKLYNSVLVFFNCVLVFFGVLYFNGVLVFFNGVLVFFSSVHVFFFNGVLSFFYSFCTPLNRQNYGPCQYGTPSLSSSPAHQTTAGCLSRSLMAYTF
jgi:hypothetical protein